MAKSIRKQIEAMEKARERYIAKVYACAPNGHTPFSECRKLAAPTLLHELDATTSALITLEQSAVSMGKAWRGSIGGLIWNR